ncbi:hypothetical protein LINPERPRIM_LOCUS20616, partial [Linum perenne]
MKGFPPPLCIHLGIDHLANQVGRPLSKFMRVEKEEVSVVKRKGNAPSPPEDETKSQEAEVSSGDEEIAKGMEDSSFVDLDKDVMQDADLAFSEMQIYTFFDKSFLGFLTVGKPWKKFAREGLDVKVCILRDREKVCPEAVTIELEDGEKCRAEIVQTKAREYKPNTQKVWRVVALNNPKAPAKNTAQVDNVEVTVVEQGIHSIPEGVVVHSTPEGVVTSKLSKTEKRRNNIKRKKSA